MREGFKNNEKFRRLIENISDGIIALDTKWQIVYANRTAEKILKRRAGTLLDKYIWDEFPGAVGGKFYQAYHEAMQTQKSLMVEEYSSTLEQWTQAVVYPSTKGLTVYFHDITAERKAKIRAEKSEANYRLFLDRITDGFVVLDKQFRYVYVNNMVGELVHRDPESLIGKNVWQEFPDAVGSLTYKAFHTAFKEQRFISNIDYFEPLDLWQENYIYPSPEGLSIFIKDISDRKQLEKQLRDKERNQQFELMVATIEAQEKERTHMGRELHDNVNQLLVATKLMLALIRDDPERVSKTVISRCIANLEKAIEENRRISHELVTPELKDQTLVDQLRNLASTMLIANNIRAVVDASDFNEMVLDEPRKLAAYRIAQEQCTNIIKYAGAKEVAITLSSGDGQFNMVISDDGVGMNKLKVVAGIGLRNIGARVGFFDGDIQIRTKPNKGFTLEIIIPVNTTPASV
jgi:signal transduction histidine kinase